MNYSSIFFSVNKNELQIKKRTRIRFVSRGYSPRFGEEIKREQLIVGIQVSYPR